MQRRGTMRVYLLCSMALVASSPLLASTPPVGSLKFHETGASIAAIHHSEIDSTAADSCEASQPPEALATPDPLLDPDDSRRRVAVSFIVGIDGRVHSPVILESAGSAEDRRVLQALRLWRYRPATCNATPTEMESQVEFSSH